MFKGNPFVNYSPSSGFRRGLIYNGIQLKRYSDYDFKFTTYFGGNTLPFISNLYSCNVSLIITKGKNKNKFKIDDYASSGRINKTNLIVDDTSKIPFIFLDVFNNNKIFINSTNGICLGDKLFEIKSDLLDIGCSDVQIEDITIYDINTNEILPYKRKMLVLYFDVNSPYVYDSGTEYVFSPPVELMQGIEINDKSFIYGPNTLNLIHREMSGYYQPIANFNVDISAMEKCEFSAFGSFEYYFDEYDNIQFTGTLNNEAKFNSNHELDYTQNTGYNPSHTLFITSTINAEITSSSEQVPNNPSYNLINNDFIYLQDNTSPSSYPKFGFKLENTNHNFDFKGGNSNLNNINLEPATLNNIYIPAPAETIWS